MDGDGMAPAEALIQDRTLGDRGAVGRATTRRPKTVRWFILRGIGMRDAAIAAGLIAVEQCPFSAAAAQ